MKNTGIYFIAVICLLATAITSCKETENQDDTIPTLGTCVSKEPKGKLTYSSLDKRYTYRTTGGGVITFDPHTYISILHDDYPGFKIELWGQNFNAGDPDTSIASNHENLNGKHIKDRLGTRRSIVFPDGAKLTMYAHKDSQYYHSLVALSIYEGAESHHFNFLCDKIEHSIATSSLVSQRLDEQEADGETGTFEFTSTGLLFVNTYNEDTPGSKVMNRVPLGELFLASPSTVSDYYDDPRIGHTFTETKGSEFKD